MEVKAVKKPEAVKKATIVEERPVAKPKEKQCNGCGDACTASADCPAGLCGSCLLGYCAVGEGDTGSKALVKEEPKCNGCGDPCTASADCPAGLCGSCLLGYCAV